MGDLGLIPGLGRSAGEGKGCPLQYSGLENSMDCRVHEVPKSRTQLRNFHFHFRGKLCLFVTCLSIMFLLCFQFSCSCLTLCDPWTAAPQASLSFITSWSLLKLMFIESVMPSNHLILCRLFSSCLQFFPASGFFQ